jgi:hypothetical protein
MENPERIFIIHVGENGVKEYLAAFFRELGVEENEIQLKVEEHYQFMIDNPNVNNMFGIKIHNHF